MARRDSRHASESTYEAFWANPARPRSKQGSRAKGSGQRRQGEPAQSGLAWVFGEDDPGDQAPRDKASRAQAPRERPRRGRDKRDPRNDMGSDPRNDLRTVRRDAPGRTAPRGRPGPRDPRDPGPRDPGRTDPRGLSRSEPRDPGRTGPRDPGRTDPRNAGAPRGLGRTDPRGLGLGEPHGPGRTDPRGAGLGDPRSTRRDHPTGERRTPRGDRRNDPRNAVRSDPRGGTPRPGPRNDPRNDMRSVARAGLRTDPRDDPRNDMRGGAWSNPAWSNPARPARTRSEPYPARPRRAAAESRERPGRSKRRPARGAKRGGVRAMPRQSPTQRVRGARGPADRLGTGALVFSIVVGLSLLAIVERSLLEGTTFGKPGPVGNDVVLKSPGEQGRSGTAPQQGGGAPDGRTPVGSAPDTTTLTAQVRKIMTAQHGTAARQAYGAEPTGQPIVNVDRYSADRTWAFGTAAIPVPASSSATPQTAFFVGRWAQGVWQVAVSGTSAFTATIGRVPASVVPPAEVEVLNRYSAVTADQAVAAVNGTRAGDGLMLPWKVGDTWTIGSADGRASSRPLGALAFWGGDGTVQAAGAGRMYRFCSDRAGRGLVMVVHRTGLASTYYRMTGVSGLRNGSPVERGTTLGRIGSDRPCGGAEAPRALVQFSLRRGAEEVPLNGANLGGWTFKERAQPLMGFAERGALQVLPGGLLANLGAVPAADPSPDLELPDLPGVGGDRPQADPSPPAQQNRSSTSANEN
ncbi:hypothetical protein Acsp03_09500 [Actinomadura sp. NBRC 104412]|uniref:hypothetical protein n=1 Tax=Actinomadura sp. NBRC 104412 TaxID=3032203 RepID=UPI0024A13828|nr:hypothetical protein [Actinomadura sp. NBRC 104412]GLZ03483.1 hypothetical protein Acsp03_09500 [Actinomadura sp. NBRC 104412]